MFYFKSLSYSSLQYFFTCHLFLFFRVLSFVSPTLYLLKVYPFYILLLPQLHCSQPQFPSILSRPSILSPKDLSRIPDTPSLFLPPFYIPYFLPLSLSSFLFLPPYSPSLLPLPRPPPKPHSTPLIDCVFLCISRKLLLYFPFQFAPILSN